MNISNLALKMYIIDEFTYQSIFNENIYKRFAYERALNDLENLTDGMKKKIKILKNKFNINNDYPSFIYNDISYKMYNIIDTKNIIKKIYKKLKPYIIKIETVGSIRRNEKMVHDIDIIIMLKKNIIFKEIIYKLFTNIIRIGNTTVTFKQNNIPIDITLVKNKNEWLFMLLHYTGPYDYNIKLRKKAKKKGLKLNQYGIFKNSLKINENFNTTKNIISFLNT